MSGSDTTIQIGSVMDDTVRKHMLGQHPPRDSRLGPNLDGWRPSVQANEIADKIREAFTVMGSKIKERIEVPDHALAAIIMGQEFKMDVVIDGKPVSLYFHKKKSQDDDICAPSDAVNDRQPSVVKELADKIAAVDDFIANVLGGKPSQVSLRSPDQLFNVTNLAPLLKIVGGGWNRVLEDAERNRRQKSPNQ